MAGSTIPLSNHENQFVGSESTEMREHYEIEYARFFNYPTALSRTSTLLRPLPNSIKFQQRGGTWLSSSTASLRLFTDFTAHSLPQLVLVVSLRQKIHLPKALDHEEYLLLSDVNILQEEHYISKLHFSWPQIQKFAMRFLNSSESLTFINSLKESLKDVKNIELPSSTFRPEKLSQNEFITANGLHHRVDDEMGHVYPAGNNNPLMETTLNYGVQYTCFDETALPCDYGGTWAPLPPSFTTLLDDSTEAQQVELPSVAEDADLNTQIATYMTDYSFNDMLSKLERVISDMGGDLEL